VTENEGQPVARQHRAGRKTHVRVTDAAAGDLDDDVIVAGIKGRKGAAFEGLPRGNQCVAVSGIEFRQPPRLA
jgi:hypothetical protein